MTARQPLEVVDYESGPGMLTRSIADSIAAIPQAFFSEEDFAHLVTALSSKVSQSNWSHFDYAEDAIGVLDDLHDDIVYRGTR